ncbi:hypothetical protein BVRB_007290 [Beta vulgaris subsp. vulgaris]|uniref:Uncharacterized protein n=1 Tax=Beta vulgaris subsp. vulgaris TaxID=3555 RepID=A0A0J8DXH3_BETVV|nr:hypothetical protein BVRB_007290 [Beta vulgaris subsp. vulgaris]
MNRALARNDNPIKRNIQVPLECYFCGREDEMEGHLICEFAARVRSCSLLGIKVEAAGRVHITSWISNYFNFFWKDGPDGLLNNVMEEEDYRCSKSINGNEPGSQGLEISKRNDMQVQLMQEDNCRLIVDGARKKKRKGIPHTGIRWIVFKGGQQTLQGNDLGNSSGGVCRMRACS